MQIKTRPRSLKFFVVGLLSGVVFAESSSELSLPGQRPTVSATTHLLFTNSKDDFDPSAETQNIFTHEGTVAADWAAWNGKIVFSNQWQPQGADSTQHPFQLEKKQLGWAKGNWEVRLGDSHQEVGRGIALSLHRNLPFGIDNTLEGLSVAWRPEGATLRGFVGRVNSWDLPLAVNPAENILADREVLLGGLETSVRLTPQIKLGGHALGTWNRNLSSTRIDKSWTTVGLTAQAEWADSWDAYVEVNRLGANYHGEANTTLPTGYGSYAAISYLPAGWKFKVEGKDYRHFQYEFRRPPTLEEDMVETINTEDVSAARIAVERRLPGTKTSIFGSYLTGEERVLNTSLHHAVLGSKFSLGGDATLELRAGYRFLPAHTRLYHASAKAKVPTFASQSIDITLRKQRSDENLNFFPTTVDRNTLEVGYGFSQKFAVTFGSDWVPSNDPATGQIFLNLGANFQSGPLAARIFVGRTSGGTQCAGGVCRIVPPFNGGLIDLAYSL